MKTARSPRAVACAVCLLLLLVAFPALAQSGFTGVEVELREEVIDLRENQQLRKKGAKGPGAFSTPAELVVGSIFLDVEGNARKVVAIYDDDGVTMIETVQPDIDEVYYSLTVPDQTIPVTLADIDRSSLPDYVTILDPSEAAAAVRPFMSTVPADSMWLETDPQWMGSDVLALAIDYTVLLGNTPNLFNPGLTPEKGDKDKSDGGDGGSGGDDGKSDSDGGGNKPEGSAKLAGSIALKGILRLAAPVFKAGVQMPSMHITWVRWWYLGYPKITFPDGYAHASLEAAQQFDFNLETSVSLSGEVKIPVLVLPLVEPHTQLKLSFGLSIKIGLSGEITVGFEVCEYTSVGVWGTVDLGFPFIPKKARTGSSHYENFIVRPYIDATAVLKGGPYIGGDLSIAGINLLSLEFGGGLYVSAEGYLEAMNVVGYNSNVGAFGWDPSAWDDWIYQITLELGAYIEGTLTIVFFDIPLYEVKWPILTVVFSGEI